MPWQCSICFGVEQEDLVSTPCVHVFHGLCVEPWINSRKHCPLCRTKVLSSELIVVNTVPTSASQGTCSETAIDLDNENNASSVNGTSSSRPPTSPDSQASLAVVRDLNRRLASMEQRAAAFQMQAEQERKTRRELDRRVESLQSENEIIRQALKDARVRVRQVEDDRSNLSITNDSLQAQVRQLKRDLDVEKSYVKAARAEVLAAQNKASKFLSQAERYHKLAASAAVTQKEQKTVVKPDPPPRSSSNPSSSTVGMKRAPSKTWHPRGPPSVKLGKGGFSGLAPTDDDHRTMPTLNPVLIKDLDSAMTSGKGKGKGEKHSSESSSGLEKGARGTFSMRDTLLRREREEQAGLLQGLKPSSGPSFDPLASKYAGVSTPSLPAAPASKRLTFLPTPDPTYVRPEYQTLPEKRPTAKRKRTIAPPAQGLDHFFCKQPK